jgi:hypothetical protein
VVVVVASVFCSALAVAAGIVNIWPHLLAALAAAAAAQHFRPFGEAY